MTPLVTLDRLRSGDVPVVVSVSGGKDSLAAALHLRSLGIPFRSVFADTGWESDHTYRYLEEVVAPALGDLETVAAEVTLPAELIPLAERVEAHLGRVSPMVRRCLLHATYPRRTARWCTRELKLAPIRAMHQRLFEAHGRVPVAVVGVRAAESRERADLAEWEAGDPLDALVWRPIIGWSEQQVIDIITAAGLPPNPLYLQGCQRVGCWPCIHARKDDYAVLARDTRRVAALRELERVMGDLTEARLAAQGLTLDDKGWKRPTWHHGWPAQTGPLPLMPPIDDVLGWAVTNRGRQAEMFRGDELARGGCMRWGLCEMNPEPSVEVLGDGSGVTVDPSGEVPGDSSDPSRWAEDDTSGGPVDEPSHGAQHDASPLPASEAPPEPSSPGPRDRSCAWCAQPLPPRARRDAVYCSQRCRQAANRVKVEVVRLEHDSRSLRLAYADPPYPGLEHYYRGHPDHGGVVDLRNLLQEMNVTYDGWALSTSAWALPAVLVVARDLGIRPAVAAWLRGSRKTPARHPLSSWEPVIYVRARSSLVEDQIDDSLIFAPRARRTDPKRVIGAKPPQFVTWMLGLLGARADDQLDDLFPGSGMVARVWTLATSEPLLEAQ